MSRRHLAIIFAGMAFGAALVARDWFAATWAILAAVLMIADGR